MPGCCITLANEEEESQENYGGQAITLHVHHKAHQEGAISLYAATLCGLAGKYSYLCLQPGCQLAESQY